MSSEFSFLSNDDDQRWWLIGFVIVSVLFVATLVSVLLGGGSNPEMNALSGLLIAVFISCGAYLGALFVDRAGTATGMFSEEWDAQQTSPIQESVQQSAASHSDLDRQMAYYLRRVYREFSREPSAAAEQVRPAPVLSRPLSVTSAGNAATSTRSGATSPVEMSQEPATGSGKKSPQSPKSLAEWTPPPAQTDSAAGDITHGSKRHQRRDWVA